MPIVQKSIAIAVAVCFLSGSLSPVQAQPLSAAPVVSGASFHPPLLQGVRVDVQNPFQLEFVVDPGEDSSLSQEQLSSESMKLVKYFLASLTVPGDDLWVNLSPAEPDRIIPQAFGQTAMGRDMLAQDYLLKQLTASLMNPEGETGKIFWEKIYERLYENVETHSNASLQNTIETFNKVWIMPDVADVYQNESAAYIVNAKLKVMLEEDYNQTVGAGSKPALTQGRVTNPPLQDDIKSVIQQTILPIIEKEINEGEQFARLRQIYHAVILAKWFKDNLRSSLLGAGYADRNVVDGIDESNPAETRKIYDRYLEAFRRGAYDVIKEDYDPVSQEIIPRKYFTGGVVMEPQLANYAMLPKLIDGAMLAQVTLADIDDSNSRRTESAAGEKTNAAMMAAIEELKSKAFQSFNKTEQKRLLKLFEKIKRTDNLDISGDDREFLLRILVSDNLYNNLWQTRAAQILLKVRLNPGIYELMVVIIRGWIAFKWSYMTSIGPLRYFLEILQDVYRSTLREDLKQQIKDIFSQLEKHSDILIQNVVKSALPGVLQPNDAPEKLPIEEPKIVVLDQFYRIYSEEDRMFERVRYFREMLIEEAVQKKLGENSKAVPEVVRKEVEKAYQSRVGLMVSPGNRKSAYFIEEKFLRRMEEEGRLARKRMDEGQRQKFMHATRDKRLKTWVSLVTYREKFYQLLSEMTGDVISDPWGLAAKVMEGNSQWNVWIMLGWHPPAGSIHAFLDQLLAKLEVHFIDTVEPAQKEELRKVAGDFLFSVPAVYPAATGWEDFHRLMEDVSQPSRQAVEKKKLMFAESLIAKKLKDSQNVAADALELRAMAEQYVFEEQMGVRASASSLKNYLLFMKTPLFHNFLEFSGFKLTSDTPVTEEGWFNRENIHQRYRFTRTFLSQMKIFQKLLTDENIAGERYVGYRRNKKNNRNLSVSLEGLFLMEQMGLLERLDIYSDWQAGQEALGLTRGRWDYYKDRFLEFFDFLQERYSARLMEEYSYDPQQAGLQARQQIETTFVKSAYDNQKRAAVFFSEKSRTFFKDHPDVFIGPKEELEKQRDALAAKIIEGILLPVFKFQTPQELFFTGAFEGLSFNHSQNKEKTILEQLLHILDASDVDLTPADLRRELIKIKGEEDISLSRVSQYIDAHQDLYFHPGIKLKNPFRRGDPLAEALVAEIKRILKASPVRMDLQKIYKEVQRDPRFSKTPKAWVRFAVETEKTLKTNLQLIRRSIPEMQQVTKKRRALIRKIFKEPKNKDLTAVQIKAMLEERGYQASLDVIGRDVHSVRIRMGQSVEIRDPEEVRKRREKILEILVKSDRPLTRQEILDKLRAMPEYAYVTRLTVKNDTTLDSRIKNHRNLKVEDGPVQDKDLTRYRRNAIFRFLERSPNGVTRNDALTYLKKVYPEFAKANPDQFKKVVWIDFVRDDRLKHHRNFRKEVNGIDRTKPLAEAFGLPQDAVEWEFYKGLIGVLSDEKELFIKKDFYIFKRSFKVSVTKTIFPTISSENLKQFTPNEQAVLDGRYRGYKNYSYNPICFIEIFEGQSQTPVGYVWFQALYGQDEYIESFLKEKSPRLHQFLKDIKAVFNHMTKVDQMKEKSFERQEMKTRRSLLQTMMFRKDDPEQATIFFIKWSIEVFDLDQEYQNRTQPNKTNINSAMLAEYLAEYVITDFLSSQNPGGVDFRMDGFDVKVDGEAQVFDSAMISGVKINGLHPVSIKLTPLKELAAFLGSPAQIAAGPS